MPDLQNRNRREFLKTTGLGALSLALAGGAGCSGTGSSRRLPNFVVIFCDDLGYGDLASFGHPTTRTPNLDRMVREGQKWTNFYAAASVCTPSRAALMTGRLPIRSGMCSDVNRVLFPDSTGGMPAGEITIAEALREVGYATACIGKWHLGHLPQYLPTRHGFDSYFGVPYSNDMDRVAGEGRQVYSDPKVEYWNIPLMRDETIIERPADQNTLTKRYTEEAIRVIRANTDRPFFCYLAHNMPHVPLFRSAAFRDRSLRMLYGDVVEEIDQGAGAIMQAIREEGIAENTLVVFTSDNGPWLSYHELGGSAGLLRDGKGTTWEGGMREPTIFWWPGRIEPGMVTDLGSTLDLLPTLCALAGAGTAPGRVLDGVDLSPVMNGTGPAPRDTMFYYRGRRLYAVRKGLWKAHFLTQPGYGANLILTEHDPPLLYHLGRDPGERYDVSADNPDVVAELKEVARLHMAGVVPGEDQLAERIPAGS